jgi:hypothetical protein
MFIALTLGLRFDSHQIFVLLVNLPVLLFILLILTRLEDCTRWYFSA